MDSIMMKNEPTGYIPEPFSTIIIKTPEGLKEDIIIERLQKAFTESKKYSVLKWHKGDFDIIEKETMSRAQVKYEAGAIIIYPDSLAHWGMIMRICKDIIEREAKRG